MRRYQVLHNSARLIWLSHRFGMWLVFVCLTITACLLHWLPSPGIGVAVMGIAAALMTARKDPTAWEKAAWTFAMFGLLVVEILAIRKDRREHDAQMKELLQQGVAIKTQAETKFDELGHGIKTGVAGILQQSNQQFQSTLQQQNRQFAATMSGLNENLNVTSGDGSFCFLRLASAKLKTSELGQQLDKLPMFADLVKRGKYPLYSIYLQGLGTTYYTTALPEMANMTMMTASQFHLSDLPEGDGKDFYDKLVLPYKFDSRGVDVHLSFNARNGIWHQIILIRRVDDLTGMTNFSVATRVYGIEITKSSVLHKLRYEQIDKDFSEKNITWDVNLLAP